MSTGRYKVRKTPITLEAANRPPLTEWYWSVLYEGKTTDNVKYSINCGYYGSFQQAWRYLNGIL